MFGVLKYLLLDKRARQALDKPAAKAAPRPKAEPPPERQRTPHEAIADAEERIRNRPKAPAMTPERQKLIQEAMAVHKAKRKILDALSDEDRARLVAMAITAVMGEGRPPEKKK